ncbi:MAG: cellulase family glycosylhydrolase [Clostridia bacterium]|nr:cellulase family glycosylhydrolase [Clostridia bacterium]
MKTKHAVLAVLLAILIAGFFALPCRATAEASAFPDAHAVLKDMGAGWNLGNSLDAWSGTQTRIGPLSSETAWGNPVITRELIALVKASGFRTIRLPVTWFNHMDPETNQIDEAWMSRVEEVVGWVLDEGMYCILNVHHDTGSDNWLIADSDGYAAREEKFTAIWHQIAERFASQGDHLLFEGYNEILNGSREWTRPDQASLDAANRLNQAFVDTVRATGGNNATRCLIVNTYGAQPNALITQGMRIPADTVEDRIIVEVHFYQPYQFTSESYPGVTTWDKGSVDTSMANFDRDFIQKGYPVLIGEFGAVDKGKTKARFAWTKYVTDRAAALGIGCIWWDNGAEKEYSLFDRRTLRVTQPELIEIILTETGGANFDLTDEVVAQAESRLAKTNLCAAPEKWSAWIDTANGGGADVQYSVTGVHVTVSSPGKEAWHVQPAYVQLKIESGVTYRLSFDYSAEPAQEIPWHLMKDYGDYAAYQEGVLEAKNETQHFELVFTMTEPTDGNCKIAFDLGGNEKAVPFVFEINNLTLVKE